MVPLFLRSWQDNVDIRLGGENYLESSQSHQLLACTSILCLVHCVLHGDTSWQYSYTFAPVQSAQVKATLSVHTAIVATIALNVSLLTKFRCITPPPALLCRCLWRIQSVSWGIITANIYNEISPQTLHQTDCLTSRAGNEGPRSLHDHRDSPYWKHLLAFSLLRYLLRRKDHKG